MATTYGTLFDEYLHAGIAAGGEVDRVCVMAVAFLRNDVAVRNALFRDWVGGERFECGHCRQSFTLGDGADEQDDVLCDWCRNGYRVGGDIVPHYRRTFAR